jgi:hypothetical protein
MAASLMAIKALLSGIEYTGMDVTDDTTHYKAKVKGVLPRLIKARVILNALTDIPPRIPRNITVKPGETGIILKDNLVEWDVRTRMRPTIPRLREVLDEITMELARE